MGHSATVPGAILAADVPAALQRLQAGVTAAPQSGAAADDNARRTLGESVAPCLAA